MAKHTPGPWDVRLDMRNRQDNSIEILSQPEGIFIASAYEFNRKDRDVEQEANALLIAAAPDLLAACEAAREWMGERPADNSFAPYDQSIINVIDALEAAIAKATPAPKTEAKTRSTVELNKEGWTWLHKSPKWHYFVENRSLCGRWGLVGLIPTLRQDNDDSPDNCAACKKQLASRRARKVRNA